MKFVTGWLVIMLLAVGLYFAVLGISELIRMLRMKGGDTD